MCIPRLITTPAIHPIPTITDRAITTGRAFMAAIATTIGAGIRLVITEVDIAVATINQRANDEKPFIGDLFQSVSGTHQIWKTMSDLSTVTE